MARYNLRKRKIAPFGSVETATLAAAGITAAATAAGAALSAKAQNDAAKTEQITLDRTAKIQADSMKQMNEHNKELQEEQLEAQRQMNAEQNEIQKGIQMDIQMLAGKQTQNERLDAAKIQVRNGGSLVQKSRLANVRGYNGMLPFKVTDGGAAIPLSIDNNGFGLYELQGDDHKHYHKTISGKYKSGVGIKFANGQVIEGEGNQNSDKGEKMYVTPNDVMFISKHTLDGFNPANAVDNGMHPEQAFNIQEYIKRQKGITDSGKKAEKGVGVKNPYGSYNGALIQTAGNIGGAIINGIGNHFAANRLSKAYRNTGNLLADAYSRFTTIDDDFIDRDQFKAAHAMAVLKAPIVNTETQRTAIARSRDRMLDNADKYSASGASANNRKNLVETSAIDEINKVENDANKIREEIKQNNASTLTKVANENANRDTQSFRDFIGAKLDLKKYNNDINNTIIAGVAQSLGDAITQAAGIQAQLGIDSASKLGNAIATSAQAIGNQAIAIESNRQNFLNTIAPLDAENQAWAIITRGDENLANQYIDATKNSTNAEEIASRTKIENAFNKKPSSITATPNTTNSYLENNVLPNLDLNIKLTPYEQYAKQNNIIIPQREITLTDDQYRNSLSNWMDFGARGPMPTQTYINPEYKKTMRIIKRGINLNNKINYRSILNK